MIPIKCRGLLFDLDGVLVDSTPAVARVWAGWAREHGFDPDKIVREAHGKPSIATIRELLPNADRSEERRVGKEWRYQWSREHEKKKQEAHKRPDLIQYDVHYHFIVTCERHESVVNCLG